MTRPAQASPRAAIRAQVTPSTVSVAPVDLGRLLDALQRIAYDDTLTECERREIAYTALPFGE